MKFPIRYYSKKSLNLFLKNIVVFYIVFFLPVTNFLPFGRIIYLSVFIFLLFISIDEYKANWIYVKVLALFLVIIILQTVFYGKGSLESFVGVIIFITYPFLAIIIFKTILYLLH